MPVVHVDFREILDRKDIDAVVVGTPDHWHVPVTIASVRAGKDVYCEKPVTHTLGEAAPLIAAVRETQRIVQTGTAAAQLGALRAGARRDRCRAGSAR